MADKVRNLNLKGITSVFRILSNTDRSKVVDLGPNVATKNSFDGLLLVNMHLLWQELEKNKSLKDFGELKTSFCGYFGGKFYSKVIENTLNCTGPEVTSALNDKGSKSSFNSSAKRCTSSNTVRWIFSQICLKALSCLKKTLRAMKSSDNSAKDPVVDLSISDQQTVKTVIQLIVVLGVCPNFVEGVGIPVEQRTGFSAALGSEQDTRCPKCLYECVMVLISCLTEPSLSLVILSKHLADILAALIQLGHCQDLCDKDSEDVSQENGSTAGEKAQLNDGEGESIRNTSICDGGVLITKAQQEECKRALNNIVNKMYQPLIIRELLFLQGSMSGQRRSPEKSNATKSAMGEKFSERMSKQKESSMSDNSCVKVRDVTGTPAWIKDVCGHLLSKCLTKKNGVQNVLRAVLDGVSGWCQSLL
jgi:hypothetical protein